MIKTGSVVSPSSFARSSDITGKRGLSDGLPCCTFADACGFGLLDEVISSLRFSQFCDLNGLASWN
jgi:hypothetical protein